MSVWNQYVAKDITDVQETRPPYLADGAYLLEVESIEVKTKRAGGEYFVAEFKILESNNPLRPVNSRTSFYVDLSSADRDIIKLRFRDITEFLTGFGLSVADVQKGLAHAPGKPEEAEITGTRQDLTGALIRFVGTETTSKKGKKFLQKMWVRTAQKQG